MTAFDQSECSILESIASVVVALAGFDVRYALTGSLAAVAHGVGRAQR